MKPWVKTTVGILCHVPAVYLLYFMTSFFWMITHILRPLATGGRFALVFPAGTHLGVTLLILALVLFFAIWLWKFPGLTLEWKMLWVLGMLLVAPAVLPVLYWLYLRHTPPGPYTFGYPLPFTVLRK